MDGDILSFLVTVLSFWVVINIVYIVKREAFERKNLKLYYGVVLVYRRKYSPKPRNIYRELSYLSIPLSLYGIYVFYATMGYTILVKLGFINVPGFRGPTLLIPGINITGMSLLYFTIAIVIAAAVHELAHAFTAASNNIRVKGLGFAILFFIPIAFTEIDEEEFPKASLKAKTLTLMAGPAANILLALIMIGVLTLAISPYGLVVTDVVKGSVAEKYGLTPNSIILEINDEPATLDNLKVVANTSVSTNFTLKILLPSGETRLVNITKPAGERIGIYIIQMPSMVLIRNLGVEYSVMLMNILIWIQVVNLSLGIINIAPLFVTDGGRIAYEISRKPLIGHVASIITLAILIIALVP